MKHAAHPAQSPDCATPSPSLRAAAEARVQQRHRRLALRTGDDVKQLIHELQVYQVELEMQNEELKEAQLELAQSRDRLSDLYDFAPVGYVTLDLAGVILEANLTVARMLGVPRGQLLNAPFTRFVAREDQDVLDQHRQAVHGTRASQKCEVALCRVGRSSLPVCLESVTFTDPASRSVRWHAAVVDITERKSAEAQLRESEHRFASLFRSSPIPTTITRLKDGLLQDVNEAFLELVGYDRQEVVGHTAKDLDLWMEPENRQELVRRLKEEGSVSGFEAAFRKKSGGKGTVLISAAFVDLGSERHILATGLDHTERRRMEDELRRSREELELRVRERTAELQRSHLAIEEREQRHRAVLQTAMDGFCRVDMQGRVIEVNESYCRMTGYSEAELLTMNVSDLQTIETHEETAARIRMIQAQGWARFETRQRCRDGSAFDVEISVQYKPEFGGSLVAFLHDITERRRAEEALRVLTARMDDIREQERQRLGRELHDGLSQLLTATKFSIGVVKRQLERQMPLDAAEVGGLEDQINQALEQARGMAHGLNPANLVARGLVAALEDLARGVAKAFQVHCVCESAAPVVVDDQTVALHLYRIAQEAVQNAVQHGQPRHVVIRLAEREHTGGLEVLDDGAGFSPLDPPTGMGLTNMQVRARAIGGRLEIRRRSSGGMAITCSWPIRPSAVAPASHPP